MSATTPRPIPRTTAMWPAFGVVSLVMFDLDVRRATDWREVGLEESCQWHARQESD